MPREDCLDAPGALQEQTAVRSEYEEKIDAIRSSERKRAEKRFRDLDQALKLASEDQRRKIEAVRSEYESKIETVRNKERKRWESRCDELNAQMIILQKLSQVMENNTRQEAAQAIEN